MHTTFNLLGPKVVTLFRSKQFYCVYIKRLGAGERQPIQSVEKGLVQEHTQFTPNPR